MKPQISIKEKLAKYSWSGSRPCSKSRPRSVLTVSSSSKIQRSTDCKRKHLASAKVTPTSSSNKSFSYTVLSVVEGRGSSTGKIGIASLNLCSPAIEVSQFHDTSSYSRTLVKLLLLNPNEIIVPHSALDPTSCMQKLVRILQTFSTKAQVIGVHRGRFNDKQGLYDLQRMCHPEYHASIYAIKERFYALAATASIFYYAEKAHGFLCAPRSLRFICSGSVQTTMIDPRSAQRLELIPDTREISTKNCLYGAIDYTCTPGGAKILRANLLEPPCDLPTILQRQEAINELVTSPDTVVSIQNILRQFPYIDSLLSLCVHICTSPVDLVISSAITTPADGSCKGRTTVASSQPIPTLHMQQKQTAETYISSTQGTKESAAIGTGIALPESLRAASNQTENTLFKGPPNLQAAESRITKVIMIKSMLDLVPQLHGTLTTVQSSLLKTYRELLCDPGYQKIRENLCTILHTDVKLCRGSLSMRSQRCFAIKEGISVLLDVTRKAYAEQLYDLTMEVNRLAQKLRLPLRVAFNKMRGFHVQFSEASLNMQSNAEADVELNCDNFDNQAGESNSQLSLEDSSQASFNAPLSWSSKDSSTKPNTTPAPHSKIPPELIKPYCSRGIIYCTTELLIRLNERMKGSLHEVYTIADQIICDLISKLHPEMSLFYRLSEVVAGLDFLTSFARMVMSSSPGCPYTYPRFADRIAIKNGRNIVLQRQSMMTTVPNHTYASTDSSMTVITGPSMSGKTTYLKQVAYTQILAQIGAPVPADFASVRITDQIFFHCSGADDLISNESSFTREMKEISYILRHATGASLILIDGLCQNTSLDEAVSLGWAICEDLMEKKAFTFLATQCAGLTHLASISDHAEMCHFLVRDGHNAVEASRFDGGMDESVYSISAVAPEGSIQMQTTSATQHRREWVEPVFTYKLLKGTAKRQTYGIQTARLTVIPEEVIKRAEEVFSRLTNTNENESNVFNVNIVASTPVQSSIVELGLPSTLTTSARNTSFVNSKNDQCFDEAQTAFQAENSGVAGDEQESYFPGRRLTAERLKVRLLRQLSILSKAFRDHGTERRGVSRSMEQKVLPYLQFLQDRYKTILSANLEE